MSKPEITVRLMRQQDVPAVVEIDRIASGSPRAEYIQAKSRDALDARHGMVISLVAEAEGKVVGFVMGEVFRGEFGVPEGVATVDTVGIYPELQGHGVGLLLMDEFVTHVRKAGVERIRTIIDWNQWDLVRFFHKSGFAPATSIVLERTT